MPKLAARDVVVSAQLTVTSLPWASKPVMVDGGVDPGK